MALTLFLGYFAGFLTTVSLVPQVIKMWTTKSARFFVNNVINLVHRNQLLGSLWCIIECRANYFMECKHSHSGNCYPGNEIKIYKVCIRIN